MTPDGLPEFVLARIAEREAAARAATPGPWRYNPSKHNVSPTTGIAEESVFAGAAGPAAITVASTGPSDDPQSMVDAAHIATWDPAHVLAVCEVHRRIVEHEAPGPRSRGDGRIQWEYLPPVLRLLGSLDAEHPDYQEIWKP